MRPYYHVSRKHLGASVVLIPKQPLNATWMEASLPDRVCFAPTVEQCLASISGAQVRSLVIGETLPKRRRVRGEWHHANPSVYTTNRRLRKPPQDCTDFSITEERWSLSPIEVVHAGFVCLAHLSRTGQVRLVKRSHTPTERISRAFEQWGDNSFL